MEYVGTSRFFGPSKTPGLEIAVRVVVSTNERCEDNDSWRLPAYDYSLASQEGVQCQCSDKGVDIRASPAFPKRAFNNEGFQSCT